MEKCTYNTINSIRELLEFINDGKKGYQQIAEKTSDEHLRRFCIEHSLQRQIFASELNGILNECGVDAEKSGTLKGALYRQWIEIKTTLGLNDEDSIIAICIYGEEWTLKAYNDALSNEISTGIREIITNQRDQTQKAFEELKEMETLHHH